MIWAFASKTRKVRATKASDDMTARPRLFCDDMSCLPVDAFVRYEPVRDAKREACFAAQEYVCIATAEDLSTAVPPTAGEDRERFVNSSASASVVNSTSVVGSTSVERHGRTATPDRLRR